jgi:guanosine-3',5'-bis(diphosphate) 3'-pyrophosphohydrolase
MNTSIETARQFALTAHVDQTYGQHPYAYHLDAVVQWLVPFGDDAQIAGYLHDTVEDTETTLSDITANFGAHIAECVALVTDETGSNRKERKLKTNAKLAATANSLALIVKAADRLANLCESSLDPSTGKLEMYCREHDAFRAAAFRAGLCDDLWARMDHLLMTAK